jgi:hypothetical protein
MPPTMKDKIIAPGELFHVLHRFEKEIKRHFVGEVESAQGGIARVSGYVFVVDDPRTHLFVKRPDRRTKLVAFGDGELLINVLPGGVKLEDIRYETKDHRLYVTDGKNWTMDLKEFGWN